MPTQAEALAALDAHPDHDAALPFLREWALSGDPHKIRHVLVRLATPVRPEPSRGAPIQPPGLLSRAASFAGAVVTHVAAGMQTVDEAEYQRRLALCQGTATTPKCEHFDAMQTMCRICGCNANAPEWRNKLRWAEQHCPILKW